MSNEWVSIIKTDNKMIVIDADTNGILTELRSN